MTQENETLEKRCHMFAHFVLTRFNVRNSYHLTEPSDAWLIDRLALFKKFCIPSLSRQSEKEFEWLVFVDSKSPLWFLAEMESLAVETFEMVLVDGAFDCAYVSSAIASRTGRPYIITTRVDNDDAVARDFVEVIQSCFTNQAFEFINLVHGAQFAQRKTYLRPYTKNPFISLIERPDSSAPSTVFVTHHYRVQEKGTIRNIRTSHPMWLQVVHGGNILNEVVGLRIPGTTISRHFECELSFQDGFLDLSLGFLGGLGRIAIRFMRKPARVIEAVKVLRAFHPSQSGGSFS